MSRIGVRPAFSAAASVTSSHSHEYPRELGSEAVPEGGAFGAISFHAAMIRTYEAPAARAFTKPSAR